MSAWRTSSLRFKKAGELRMSFSFGKLSVAADETESDGDEADSLLPPPFCSSEYNTDHAGDRLGSLRVLVETEVDGGDEGDGTTKAVDVEANVKNTATVVAATKRVVAAVPADARRMIMVIFLSL